MKSAKQIYKEVRALATEQEQQKYINALTEKDTQEFHKFLLRFPGESTASLLKTLRPFPWIGAWEPKQRK